MNILNYDLINLNLELKKCIFNFKSKFKFIYIKNVLKSVLNSLYCSDVKAIGHIKTVGKK